MNTSETITVISTSDITLDKNSANDKLTNYRMLDPSHKLHVRFLTNLRQSRLSTEKSLIYSTIKFLFKEPNTRTYKKNPLLMDAQKPLFIQTFI